jgi:hypothetical protein
MTDLEQMLKRQAQWQKSRQDLMWPEKIRLAEQVRESVSQWRVRPAPLYRGRRSDELPRS